MNPTIKLNIIRLLRFALRIFYIFPIKRNRILFSAYEGRSYTCNPKYIYEYLKQDHGYELVWCINDKNKLPEDSQYIKSAKFLTPKHIYYIMTSKVIISNLGIEPFIPKRRNQIFINTWHGGGAYKRQSSDMNVFSQAEKKYTDALKDIRKHNTDYFLTSSEAFTSVMVDDMHLPQEVMVSTGMPRNDILINSDDSVIKIKRDIISKDYDLPKDALWVLYAPTFRGTYRNQTHIDNQIISQQVIDSFKRRFNKDVFILNRAHISKEMTSMESGNNCRDLTAYQDMQELLLVCDILITDYSSSVWDFSLTSKPGFLFVPDLKEYEYKIGFYTPFKDWPFPYAENIDELCHLIETYDEIKGNEKSAKHLNLLKSYEKGDATKQVADLINTIVNN